MIVLRNISKKFGDKMILSQASHTFREGEIASITAPNGTGKTTLLSIISGLLLPDEGTVVYGSKNGCRGVNIVLSGERNLYVKNTVQENLLYLGAIRGMSRKEIEMRIEQYQKYFPVIHQISNTMIEKLSYGQKRLTAIFSAVISDADCVLLDEVTEGLDMEYICMLQELLTNISENKVILLASHDYDFVAGISDSIVFFKEGKLMEQRGRFHLEELKEKYMQIYGLEGGKKDA
ncbi:MAG: ATP-binding cassette domain-containing protein [Lachnospiraceae bacterium]|nr:ATP-binding cassette domain-containing protein [Lachnospiraceae bacterium]